MGSSGFFFIGRKVFHLGKKILLCEDLCGPRRLASSVALTRRSLIGKPVTRYYELAFKVGLFRFWRREGDAETYRAGATCFMRGVRQSVGLSTSKLCWTSDPVTTFFPTRTPLSHSSVALLCCTHFLIETLCSRKSIGSSRFFAIPLPTFCPECRLVLRRWIGGLSPASVAIHSRALLCCTPLLHSSVALLCCTHF